MSSCTHRRSFALQVSQGLQIARVSKTDKIDNVLLIPVSQSKTKLAPDEIDIASFKFHIKPIKIMKYKKILSIFFTPKS